MAASPSTASNPWEILAQIGFFIVIVGVIGEGAELLVKLTRKRAFRSRFQWSQRRALVALVQLAKTRLLEIETGAFCILLFGLSLEFVAGAKALRITKRQNAELYLQAAVLESNNVAQQQEINELALDFVPRSILFDLHEAKFQASLKGKPIGEAEILYLPEDVEAEQFGMSIFANLHLSGWAIPVFWPIPSNMLAPVFRGPPDPAIGVFTLQERATGTIFPLVIFSRHGTASTLAHSLSDAFWAAGVSAMLISDDTLPSNKVVFVIGKNQPTARIPINPNVQ